MLTRIFGDRLSATPPEFYLPIETAQLALTLHGCTIPAQTGWMSFGRVKPGVVLSQLQEKLSGLLRQTLATIHTFTTASNKPLLPRVHVVLTFGGAGIRNAQEQYSSQLYLLMALSGLILLIVHIDPQAAGYLPSQVGLLYQAIEQRFHTIPGILKVGIFTYAPMKDQNSSWSVEVQGQPYLHVHASYVKCNPEYFDAVSTRMLLGRGIGEQDTPASTAVAVVNQPFVKSLFKAGENPIRQHFGTGPRTDGDYRIVGVVEDTVYTDVRWKNHAMYFLPILQRSPNDKTPINEDDDFYANVIVLKTIHPIGDMESLTRRTLADINPNLAVVKFQTFKEQIADQFSDARMIARLTLFFWVLPLLLATIGLYGVTSYTVSRRTGEIGIRMALGAEHLDEAITDWMECRMS